MGEYLEMLKKGIIMVLSSDEKRFIIMCEAKSPPWANKYLVILKER
jgi:hypothetical protein